MSSIHVDTTELANALVPLSKLFPKGSKTVPLGLHVENGKFTITCQQGLVYQTILNIDNHSAVHHVTVLYFDIVPMLDMDNDTEFQFEATSVIVSNVSFSIVLQNGYSVVDCVKYQPAETKSITNDKFIQGINMLSRMRLNILYSTDEPIHIIDDVMIQKFPNTWVQVRADGMKTRAIVDMSHIMSVPTFKPTAVSEVENNIITFLRGDSMLRIACKPLQSDEKITSLMEGMNVCVRLKLRRYLDKINALLKLESKTNCQIALYPEGMRTTVTYSGASFSAVVGNTDGGLIKVFSYPASVWQAFIKLLGVDHIEILFGGDKVCLRSALAVIVTRVLH